MSITCHFLFNSARSSIDLAGKIEESVGISLCPPTEEQDSWHGTLFGMDFYLSVCDFENDLGIPFSDYSHALGIKSWAMGPVQGIELDILILVIHVLYRSMGTQGIVVWQLQQVIARYEVRDLEGQSCLFDTISGTFVSSFSEHAVALDDAIR